MRQRNYFKAITPTSLTSLVLGSFIPLQLLFVWSFSWDLIPPLETSIWCFQTGICCIDVFSLFFIFRWLSNEKNWKIINNEDLSCLLLISILAISTAFSLIILPIMGFSVMFANYGGFTCTGRYRKIAFPQYHKTIYIRPYDCCEGINRGGIAYIRNGWNLTMRKITYHRSGVPMTPLGPEPNSDVIEILGAEGEIDEEAFPVTVFYNLKTEEIKKIARP
jgi:hypothetical protein